MTVNHRRERERERERGEIPSFCDSTKRSLLATTFLLLFPPEEKARQDDFDQDLSVLRVVHSIGRVDEMPWVYAYACKRRMVRERDDPMLVSQTV